MQNPPPPPPPPMVPPGQPPAMPPSYGGAIAAPAGNLASPGLRIVGGLIDAILLLIVIGIVEGVSKGQQDRKSTRLNSSHMSISYAVFCLKKKKEIEEYTYRK